MYKLHITLDIGDLSLPGDDSIGIAIGRAKTYLEDMHLVIDGVNRYDGIPVSVSLVRDGDRSGANLLSKSEDGGHYKHHKVPIIEII